MVQSIFEVLSSIVVGVGELFISIFTALASVFYTPGVGEAPGNLTIIGIFALVAVGFGLARWGFNLLLRLLRMRS